MQNKIVKISSVISIFLFAVCTYGQTQDSLTIKYSYINSIPQNAKVFINNTYSGETPYRFTSEQIDTTKPLAIILKMEGYFDYSFSISAGELPVNKTIALVPVNKQTLRGEQTVVEDKSSYFKTPRKVVPIVVSSVISAGSGALSYYFKKLANERYDEYLATGNRDNFDETKKYDLYSGILLAAFQVGLVSLIYFLLID